MAQFTGAYMREQASKSSMYNSIVGRYLHKTYQTGLSGEKPIGPLNI